MSWSRIRYGARRIFGLELHRPAAAPHDADVELDAVIAERIAFLTARGVPPVEAQAQALLHVGESLTAARARLRASAEHREQTLMLRERIAEAWIDLRHAARSLARNPVLSTAMVLTLALAIGANTAIYSAVRAVILRPLPYAEPDRLVSIWETNPEFKWTHAEAAPANMFDWRERVSAFADVGGYFSFVTQSTLTGRGEPRMVSTLGVTGNFFDVLGVRATLGRTFQESETWNVGRTLVLLPAQTWRAQFGGDSSVVGGTITLDGRPAEVVGVLPDGVGVPGMDVEYFTNIGWDPASRAQTSFRRAHFVRPVARLKPGVTLEQADAALQEVVRALQSEYPGTNRVMGAQLGSLHADLIGETRRPLLVMFAAVAILLLIACANLANLLVVRAAAREREAAMRLALGAGRGHLVRRALTESGLLAVVGGALGLLLGWWGTRALVALQPPQLLPIGDVGVSLNVTGFVAAVTLASALLFGAGPALWAARRDPADVLKDAGRGATGSRRARQVGNVLLVGQVALALTLTVGAGLLVRSYAALQHVDAGFDGRNVLTAAISIPRSRYDSTAKVTAFFGELERRVRALPGVQAAAFASKVPLTPASWTSQISAQGRAIASPDEQVVHRTQTAGYHAVMGTRLIAGRFLDETDNATSVPAVVVNEAFVRQFFPGETPLGVRVTYERNPTDSSYWRTIVGIVANERQEALAKAPVPEVFEPLAQEPRRGLVLTVRTGDSPGSLAAPVRRVLAELDPTLAFSSMRTMQDVRSTALARPRFLMVVLSGFAVVGVVLAIVGVYGVVAHAARQRTREIGIRMALGAGRQTVQWLVVRNGLGLAGIGVLVGIVLTRLAARAIETLLFAVTPGDMATYLAVPALLLLTAAIACWLPAARAARADLTGVMRAD